MKRFRIHKNIYESVQGAPRNWPSYFRPKINPDGTVTLYHGLKDESLEFVLSEGKLVPKVCAEGCFGLWFGTCGERNRDYPSGYRSMISIDVPIEEIGQSFDDRFKIMNKVHVLTQKPVNITDYNFNIHKIGGLVLDDEYLEYWHNVFYNDYGKWMEYDAAVHEIIGSDYLAEYLLDMIARYREDDN